MSDHEEDETGSGEEDYTETEEGSGTEQDEDGDKPVPTSRAGADVLALLAKVEAYEEKGKEEKVDDSEEQPDAMELLARAKAAAAAGPKTTTTTTPSDEPDDDAMKLLVKAKAATASTTTSDDDPDPMELLAKAKAATATATAGTPRTTEDAEPDAMELLAKAKATENGATTTNSATTTTAPTTSTEEEPDTMDLLKAPGQDDDKDETGSQGSEDSHLMEQELLHQMLRDRETQLSQLERKLEDQNKKALRVKEQMTKVKMEHSMTLGEQVKEMESLRHHHNKLLKAYKQTKDSLDMKRQPQNNNATQQAQAAPQSSQAQQQPVGASLHLYNDIMKSVASPESRDSSYVLRMQAQLCKAMHSMGMVETQLSLSKAQSEIVTKFLKDKVALMVEEKSQVELELLNALVNADVALKEVETLHKDMMDKFHKERDMFMQKMEEQTATKDEEPSSEDEDEEEKEELKEILSQGKEEIARMEKENAAQRQKMEDLKHKLSGIKGEQFVEDLVTTISEEMKAQQKDEDDEDEDEDD